jgi:hypothetical protein
MQIYLSQSDQANRILGNRLAASVWQSAPQSCALGWSTLSWDSVTYDYGGLYSGGTPSRLTVPAGQAGFWLCNAIYAFAPDGGSVPYVSGLAFYLNGSFYQAIHYTEVNNSVEHEFNAQAIMELPALSYVEVRAYNGAALPTNTIAGTLRGRFDMIRIPYV